MGNWMGDQVRVEVGENIRDNVTDEIHLRHKFPSQHRQASRGPAATHDLAPMYVVMQQIR